MTMIGNSLPTSLRSREFHRQFQYSISEKFRREKRSGQVQDAREGSGKGEGGKREFQRQRFSIKPASRRGTARHG